MWLSLRRNPVNGEGLSGQHTQSSSPMLLGFNDIEVEKGPCGLPGVAAWELNCQNDFGVVLLCRQKRNLFVESQYVEDSSPFLFLQHTSTR